MGDVVTHVKVKDNGVVTVPMLSGEHQNFNPGDLIDLDDCSDHFRDRIMNDPEERDFRLFEMETHAKPAKDKAASIAARKAAAEAKEAHAKTAADARVDAQDKGADMLKERTGEAVAEKRAARAAERDEAPDAMMSEHAVS